MYILESEHPPNPIGKPGAAQNDIYRENAALEDSTLNYTNVYNDATQRRITLRQQIASTVKQLQSASTASEVQKLTGVLIGLDADLADTDEEVGQAASLTLVQDAENRDDQDKQNKARLEEQQSEFSEALTNDHRPSKPEQKPRISQHSREVWKPKPHCARPGRR